MDESGFVKLRIAKNVNTAMKDVLQLAESNLSLSQFAENVLMEACRWIKISKQPSQNLPTILAMRIRAGLPLHDDFDTIKQAITDLQHAVQELRAPVQKPLLGPPAIDWETRDAEQIADPNREITKTLKTLNAGKEKLEAAREKAASKKKQAAPKRAA